MSTATSAASRSFLDLFRARGLPAGLVGYGGDGSESTQPDSEAVGYTNEMGYRGGIKMTGRNDGACLFMALEQNFDVPRPAYDCYPTKFTWTSINIAWP